MVVLLVSPLEHQKKGQHTLPPLIVKWTFWGFPKGTYLSETLRSPSMIGGRVTFMHEVVDISHLHPTYICTRTCGCNLGQGSEK